MANYYASSRSSYAKMKDDDDFLNWAETIPDCEVIKKEVPDHGTLYGFLFGTDNDYGGIPNTRYVDDNEYELDLHTEIQPHLAEGWSIIFMEVGAEKLRYVSGHAAVITSTEMEFINLGSWAEGALKTLGSPLSTACEY